MTTLRRRENVVDKEKEISSPSPPSKQKGLNESKKRIIKETSQTSSKGSILTIFLIFFLLGVSARIALKLSNDVGGDDDTIQEFFPWQLQRPELSAMQVLRSYHLELEQVQLYLLWTQDLWLQLVESTLVSQQRSKQMVTLPLRVLSQLPTLLVMVKD